MPADLPIESISLEGPLANLLARLQVGWSPASLALPPVTALWIDEQPFTKQLLSAQIVQQRLKIRVRSQRDLNAFELRRIRAQTSAGGKLTGRISETDAQLQLRGSRASFELTLYCTEWEYTPPTPPVLWVARLQGLEELPAPGNLVIERQKGDQTQISTGHLVLERPGLRTFFVQTASSISPGSVWLGLDGQSSESDAPHLHHDLRLFRLLFCQPIAPDIFYGLDGEGQTTATRLLVDREAALPVQTVLQGPVPTRLNQFRGIPLRAWLAPFYSRLYVSYRQHETANAVSYSLARYGHTLGNQDLDTQYTLVAGAVWILVKALALQPAAAEQLRPATEADEQVATQLRRAALREAGPVGLADLAELMALQTERAFLSSLDAQAGPLLANELVAARLAFEQGAMHTGEWEKGNGLITTHYVRTQRLRRAYAVLLAQAIDYHGPVSEFPPSLGQEMYEGHLASPDTNEATAQEAGRYLRAEADLTSLTVWPAFGLPPLPENGLVQQFSAFAEELRQHTGGKVMARLRQLPGRAEDPVKFSFRLMVNNAPATQTALFTVEVAAGSLLVLGWTDELIELATEGDLLRFQQALINSQEFDYHVKRLLLIEDDMQRGEA